jgi:uncharacterized membrane protein YdfJ with MMPL/SSD domain
MARLEGRQWGLVAMVAGSPFVLALLLASASPGLVRPVLGTPVGAASWLLAALLGLLGGALFAGALSWLRQAPGFQARPLERTVRTVLAALVPLGLCIIPATCLLLAGPELAVRQAAPQPRRAEALLKSPRALAERLRQSLPRAMPALPRMKAR